MNEQQLNDRQGRVGEQYRPEPEKRQVERELGILYPKGRSRIALTGASGYIGHNLLQRLTEHADVVALSRSGVQRKNTEHVEWRSCDFFPWRMQIKDYKERIMPYISFIPCCPRRS
ncbi:NAD-dependent epimerase/dehydratase family protein [Paenibacillus peoriae]|uniref:NAD-dependent epimerase/dehydratase family protein n=1 Tax=Paenibacillus peoriae TaxID=59893 RepID=UPI003F943229